MLWLVVITSLHLSPFHFNSTHMLVPWLANDSFASQFKHLSKIHIIVLIKGGEAASWLEPWTGWPDWQAGGSRWGHGLSGKTSGLKIHQVFCIHSIYSTVYTIVGNKYHFCISGISGQVGVHLISWPDHLWLEAGLNWCLPPGIGTSFSHWYFLCADGNE